jgi:hypothetical protein
MRRFAYNGMNDLRRICHLLRTRVADPHRVIEPLVHCNIDRVLDRGRKDRPAMSPVVRREVRTSAQKTHT